MKKKASVLLKHPLISGSLVIFGGGMAANLFNFLFNLFMSRNLSVADYGIVASLISLIILITIPAGAITPMVVGFTGRYFAKKDNYSVVAFYFKVLKPISIVAFLLLLFSFFFSKQIGDFFKIQNYSLILAAGLSVFIIYIGVLNGPLLQAKLSFRFISFSTFLSALTKLLIGVALVLWGFGASGAVWAILLSSMVSLIIAFIPLRFLLTNFGKNIKKIRYIDLISYGLPASIATLGMTSLISNDIILVKHFFNPHDAGLYAGLSLVGKVIFFLTAPIGVVMFPIVVQKHAKKESYKNTFLLSALFIFIPSVLLTIFYFMYPDFAIRFFLKREIYLSVAPMLGLFGIFMTIYSLISIFVYYFLSIKKTKIYIPVMLTAIFQIILISIFNKNFMEVILSSLGVSVLLIIILLIYYWKTRHHA